MMKLFENKRNVAAIAVFYTFLWGLCFPLVKICMQEFGAMDNGTKMLVAGIRFIISGTILCVFMLIKDGREALPKTSDLPHCLGYGILATALQYSFTYIGLSNTDGAKGAIFDQLCVFIIVILSGLFFKNDSLTFFKIVGCIIGLAGILSVSTDKLSFTFDMMGEGMMTLSALCQAGAYFIAVFCAKRITAVKLVGYGQLSGGIILAIFGVIFCGRIDTVSSKGILTLIATAVIGALAYVLSLIPLKYFPASEISIFNLLITVFGVVMSGVMLGEDVLKLNYLISLLLISFGILLVNKKHIKIH